MQRVYMILVLLVVSLFSTTVQATIFDNRFIPFLQRPYIVVPDKPSTVTFDAFFATASQAFGDTDAEIGLPALYGRYNQAAVARAFTCEGCQNPLPSEYQNKRIIWQASGKLQAQGIECSVRKQLYEDFYAGFYWYFMRVDTTSLYQLNFLASDLGNITPAQVNELDRIRRCMNTMVGLCTGDHAVQYGLGDLDGYFMWQHQWDRLLKFRSIRAQASAGCLFPAGQSRNISEPTSIPFGGNGFWGMYAAAQGEFELKEDWKVGAFLRASKRFKRTKCQRVPLCDVPAPFSPIIDTVTVNPGPTLTFMGWVSFENVLKGLGARLLGTVRRHWQDDPGITACCGVNTPDCELAEELSAWGSDYITLNVFYDFGKIKACRAYEPIIFFAWDIPANMFVTKRAYKTNKVILGVEFSF